MFTMEFIYAINTNTDSPVMKVDRLVSNGLKQDNNQIDGNRFSTELFELASKKPKCIHIPVNSFGGSVMGALAIIGTMISVGNTETCNWGMAESCAGWILLCGDKVKTFDYAFFMCHMPEGELPPEDIERIALQIALIIVGKSGRNGKPKLTVEKVLDMMKSTTYLSGDELYDMGLCDEVVTSTGKVKEWNKSYATIANKSERYEKYSEVLNQSIKIKNTVMEDQNIQNSAVNAVVMAQFNTLVGLAPEATIPEFTKALMEIQNKNVRQAIDVTNAGTDREALAARLLAAEKAKNDSESAYNTLKNEMDMSDKAKKDAENAAIDALAKLELANTKIEQLEDVRNESLVSQYAELGKIKNDAETKKVWKDAIKASSYDTVKNQLENIPTNVAGVKIVGDKAVNLTWGGAKTTEDYMKRNRDAINKARGIA